MGLSRALENLIRDAVRAEAHRVLGRVAEPMRARVDEVVAEAVRWATRSDVGESDFGPAPLDEPEPDGDPVRNGPPSPGACRGRNNLGRAPARRTPLSR
jgi:hypothetical protein